MKSIDLETVAPLLGSAAAAEPTAVCHVTALSTTPVKGLRLNAAATLALGEVGAEGNRLFYLIDEQAQMVNGKRLGVLSAVCADYEAASGKLSLLFPDGSECSGFVTLGRELQTHFFSRTPTARVVDGPWSQALSDYAGTALRLVRADPRLSAVDRGPAGGVSLISDASIAKLASLADRTVDARRFRMLIEIAGVDAHEEDGWVGRCVRIGAARVVMRGHVGRCLVTSQCPERGVVDMPTLKLLSYRLRAETSERLAFGVFGEVLEPGAVRVGDRVELDD
jgi:uncharacterized protein YcbX